MDYIEAARKIQDAEFTRKVKSEKRISDLEQQNENLKTALIALAKETHQRESKRRQHESATEKRVLALERKNAGRKRIPPRKKQDARQRHAA